MGEKAENQRKTRKKSTVAEKQVFWFWLDFLHKKGMCSVHTPQNENKRENSECEGKGKRRGLCEGNRSVSRKR